MSRLFRLTPLRIIIAAAIIVLGGGAATGVALASGNASSAPTIDHQLCYYASAQGFQPPSSVQLLNQLSSTAGFPGIIGALQFNCNPVQKTLASGPIFPITNPNAHLACFGLNAPTQPTYAVTVTNQFGTAQLLTAQPNQLCLPTWKSLTGPPHQSPNQPPGLSHFVCYPVSPISGKYAPPALSLQDEFAPSPVAAQISPNPVQLCVPTQKTVNGVIYPIINPNLQLLCFPSSPTPIVPTVYDQNQFGNATVSIKQTSTLCLPSTMQINSTGTAPK